MAGGGVRATVDGHVVLVGTTRLLTENGVPLNGLSEQVTRLQGEAKTAMLVAVDGEAVGIIAVADTVKPTSKEAIDQLHAMGIEVVMLTGDNPRTAQAIADQVGVDRVLAEVLPARRQRNQQVAGAVAVQVAEARGQRTKLAETCARASTDHRSPTPHSASTL